MIEIADAAGVAPGTLYHYFESKEALFYYVLERKRVTNAPGELEEIVAELYDRIARGRKAADVIEASTLDQPELSEIWFARMGSDLVQRLARYIEQRAARGHFRSQTDAVVAARFVLETCVYFARKRHGDPSPEELADSTPVRATVIDLIVHSLVVPDATGRSSKPI